jgi:hypothetical protein
MMFAGRVRSVFGVLCLGACGGCEGLPISGLAPQTAETGKNASATERPRYQLETDRQGRVIRLDTVTGEITVVESNSRPAASNRRGPSESTPPQTGTAPQEPAGNRVASVPAPSIPGPGAEQVSVASSQAATALTTGADLCPRPDAFRDAVTLADVPVFIQPRELQTPLTTLPSALMVAATERAGDWYLIRFEDRRWGPRVGYVHCSGLRALEPGEAEPPR